METFQRARSLLLSDFGRKDEWEIELKGAVVGVLDDPKRVELFWYSYAVRGTPLRGTVLRDDDAWRGGVFAFRNRRTGELAHSAFCGGEAPFVRDGRVLVRGLALRPGSMAERVVLYFLLRLPGATGPGAVDKPWRTA